MTLARLDERLMCWVCQTTEKRTVTQRVQVALNWTGKKTRISNAKKNLKDRRKLEAAGSNM